MRYAWVLAAVAAAGCHHAAGTIEGNPDLTMVSEGRDLAEVPGADLAGHDMTQAASPDLTSTPPKEIVAFVRTGNGISDGSDSDYELCVGSVCNVLNNPNWNDLQRDAIDEFHFAATGLASVAAVDSVHLRWKSGSDGWKPVCLQVLLDGAPLFCDDTLDTKLGNGAGDTKDWSALDPHAQLCQSCWGTTITHGPMVGVTTTTTTKIWFRAASAAPVTLEVATDSSLAGATTYGPVYPTPDTDFMTTIDVQDLLPNTRYYYRLLVDGKAAMTSPYPSLLTAPAQGDGSQFTIGFGSCAALSDQPVFDTIDAIAPTLMIMGGDNHYANSSDLGVLRTFYRGSREKPGVHKLFQHTAVVATWDDHDFVGNNTDGTAPVKDKDTALRAFKEAWANAYYGSGGVPGIWTHTSWGDVDILLIDDRYYRGIDKSMLGAVQKAWLKDTLKASTASFKLVVSGSQWTPYGSADSWASFDDEREEILQYIYDQKIGGVVLLSGDIHRSEVRQLVAPTTGKYAMYEFTSSGLAQTPTPCLVSLGPRLECFDGNAFALFTVDTTLADPTLRFEIRDVEGNMQYSLDLARSQLQVP